MHPELNVPQRAKLIRAAAPDILESCFEQQSRICDLCTQPVQDLMLAALDHSTPVIHFARSTMPIAEAIAAANDPQNLRSAHATCNSAKRDLTREQWFARGLNNREAPRFLTEGQLLELQFRLGAGGRIGGRIGGRTNALNKTGVCGRTPEQMTTDGRKGGRIGGRISGSVVGRRHKEKGTGIFTPGMQAVGGRITGRKNKTLKRGIFTLTRAQLVENGRKNGRVNGRKAVEQKTGIFAPDYDKGKGGRIGGRTNADSGQMQTLGYSGLGAHARWHTNKGIVNPKCALCVPLNDCK